MRGYCWISVWLGSGFFISYSLTPFIHRRGRWTEQQGAGIWDHHTTHTHTHSHIYIAVNISSIHSEKTKRDPKAVCAYALKVLYPRFKAGHDNKSQRLQTHRRSEQNALRSPQKMCSSLEALAKHCAVKLIVLKTSVHFLLCKKPIPSNPLKHIFTLNNLLKPCWSIHVLTC